jgi:hypothetical protein
MFTNSNALIADQRAWTFATEIFRRVIATLLLAGVWLIDGSAPAAAQVPSGPPKVDGKRLCGDAGPKPRILIGRFSLFGDFESSLASTMEPAFVGSLAGQLLGRRDSPGSFFVWGRDAADFLETKEIASLIEDAFLGGAASVEKGDRQRQDLRAALQTHNCDYLFGGRLATDGKLVIVTRYLFNVERTEVRVPFPPLTVESRDVFQVAGLASRNSWQVTSGAPLESSPNLAS